MSEIVCQTPEGTGFALSTADPRSVVYGLFQNCSFISKSISKIFVLNIYINFVNDLKMESIVDIANNNTSV